MPDEYKGKSRGCCGYQGTEQREWNDKEVEYLKDCLAKGYSVKEIAESMDRTLVSVKLKRKRLTKTDGTYNKRHIEEKYSLNQQFLDEIKPKTVLDVYCGTKNFYEGYDTITNDIEPSIEATYHDDALVCLYRMYIEGKKFDLVDLDPFGSAYDGFDTAIKMAKKGLAITLGELGHKRWKRLDFVSTHYGIERLEDFTIENLISHIQMIGARNKKKLVVYEYREWQNIGRVWFRIEPMPKSEQWSKKE